MTACYAYPKEDEKYGTYEERNTTNVQEYHEMEICSFCQTEMSDKMILNQQEDKFMPDDEDVNLNYAINEMEPELKICPNCAQQVVPDKRNKTVTVTRLDWQSLNILKLVSAWKFTGACSLRFPCGRVIRSECSYFIYSYETHFSNVLGKISRITDKIIDLKGGIANYDLYEQWGRTSPQYHGEHPINNVTVRNCWLRPCALTS